MTIEEARDRIKAFCKKYQGKQVFLAKLEDSEKFDYILVKTFSFFGFLNTPGRLQRAIDNAEAHKRANFQDFGTYYNESMVIK